MTGRRACILRLALAAGLTAALLASFAALLAPSTALAASPSASASSPPAPSKPAARWPVPVFAYYYIWFNPSSWNRAKQDYPLLGRYSSSDPLVMRRQIELAKSAGITGFLVSWKDTPVLDQRLATLVRIAAEEHFKLGIVVEGLDFFRHPLTIAQIAASFQYLQQHYAGDAVFDQFGKPLVIWSGTWAYTPPQLASVTSAYRPSFRILASEKQVSSYQAKAGLFDGNAYYWSSADPLHTPGYQRKLDAFATAVHADHGLWIAPAAPGFNATMLAGHRVVPRRGGLTLRVSMSAAVQSSPDAIGLISWNEFSENTYIEPSKNYGTSELKTLAAVLGAPPAAVPDFNSDAPSGRGSWIWPVLMVTLALAILGGGAGVIAGRERRRT